MRKAPAEEITSERGEVKESAYNYDRASHAEGGETSEDIRPIATMEAYGDEIAVEDNRDVEYGMGDVTAAVSNSEVRGISINPLSSGYMVKVGCQSVAVESTETLVKMLDKYLTDPTDFERKWYSKNVRNRLENIL